MENPTVEVVPTTLVEGPGALGGRKGEGGGLYWRWGEGEGTEEASSRWRLHVAVALAQ
jgi:hypothetical protein